MSGKENIIDQLIDNVRSKVQVVRDQTTEDQLESIFIMLDCFNWQACMVAWCGDPESMKASHLKEPSLIQLIEICAKLLITLCEDLDCYSASTGVFTAIMEDKELYLYCCAARADSTQTD